MHHVYNGTLVILKLVNSMYTVLAHTLLDYAQEECNTLRLRFGLYRGRIDFEKLSSVYWTLVSLWSNCY